MTIEVNIISAFTKDRTGGNPAAVVLDADGLTSKQKQAIAAKVGLSETAFVSASTEADFKLDFFTPTRQIAHCGHATIASFSYLKQTGKIKGNTSSKMTIDGRREIKFTGTEAFMEQKPPCYFTLNKADGVEVISAIGISEEAVITPSPVLVNTGNAFAIIEVESEVILQSLQPQFDAIAQISEKHGLIGFYIFTRSAHINLYATVRMFAPAYGIPEESATGMAAGPLACYLFVYGNRKDTYRIEQGRFMNLPSPSLLKVELTVQGDDIRSLYAGGYATLIRKNSIDLSST